MLQITTEASTVVQSLREQRGLPDDCGLRVYANSDQGENSQRAVRLGFTDEPLAGDQVAEQDGERIFVASEVAELLDDSVLDAEGEGDRARLVLHRA